MKWTVKLVAEVVPGRLIEYEIATIERPELSSPASIGLTIAEGKVILASPYSGKSSRPRFNNTVPAFNRVAGAEKRSARRVITSARFDPFTAMSVCASGG